MKQILSPMQYMGREMAEKAVMLKVMSDLMAMHKTYIAKHEELKKMVQAPLKKGDKGDKGSSPSRGEIVSLIRPLIAQVQGGRAISREEIVSIVKSLIPQTENRKLVITESHIEMIADKVVRKIPKAPAPAVRPLPELDIENLLSLLDKRPKGKRLNMDFVDGLSQTIQSLSSQITSKGFIRGGGDVVRAGTNVTIAVDANGNKIISATGDSGGGGMTRLDITSGSFDDSNRIFGFSQRPDYIIANGIWYDSTTAGGPAGFTWNSGTLQATLHGPIGSDGKIWGFLNTSTPITGNFLTDSSGDILTDKDGNPLTVN